VIDRNAVLFVHKRALCAIPRPALPPYPWRARATFPSTPSTAARDISFSFRAANALAIDYDAAPFGQRFPWLIGDSGSPSIETSLPSLWKNQLSAPDAAIRTKSSVHFGVINARVHRARLIRIDSRPVPSLRSRICLTSGHFERTSISEPSAHRNVTELTTNILIVTSEIASNGELTLDGLF